MVLRYFGNPLGAGFARPMPPQLPAGRPEPRNSWEQAERILEILARDPIAPPSVRPYPPSPYPPAYGMGPEGDIDQEENGAWHGPGALAPGYDGLAGSNGLMPMPNWRPTEAAPWPLPVAGLDPQSWNTMGFDPTQGIRPSGFTLFNAETSPGYDGDSYAPPPSPDAAPADDDMPLRIVAVLPHRNDREIADEIFATMQRNDAARASAAGFKPYAEPSAEDIDAPNRAGQTQIAQALRPWNPYGDASSIPEAGEGIWPAGWKDGKPPRQPKYPDTDGVEGYLPPRGGGRGKTSNETPSAKSPDNLPVNPEQEPSRPQERHHWYPQQFRKWFEERGIDIDHPDNVEHMPFTDHRGRGTGLHSQGYNSDWEKFKEYNKDATLKQIEDQKKRLRKKYGW